MIRSRRSVMTWSAAAVVFVCAAVVAFVLVAPNRLGELVFLTVDGISDAVYTRRANVETLLADLGLVLRSEDRLIVEPPPQTSLGAGPFLTQKPVAVNVDRARLCLVFADGETREVYTHAVTVGDVLVEAGVRLSPHDEVWLEGAQVSAETALPPPQFPGRAATVARGRPWLGRELSPVRISLRRAVPITVDDGSVPVMIYTTAPTLGEALLREHWMLYLGDTVQPSLGSSIRYGMRVAIVRSRPVLVTVDGRTVHTRTRGGSVGDALVDLGITVSGADQVTPDLNEPIADNLQIRIVRVSEAALVEREVIPFVSVMAPDDQLEIDRQRLAEPGEDGEYRRRFRVVYEDSVEVSRTLLDEWVAAQPVTRVVAYGRKIVSRSLETPEGTFSYWRKVSMYATAYSAATSGTPRSAPWYGRTRLGWQMRKGVVAVDPNVIRLGSRVYVPGYGVGYAVDTGSGVRGRMIDLGYDDWNLVSWHQWVDVYLLDEPPRSIPWVLPKYPEGRFPRR